jgi:hypothetical protein
MTTPDNTQQPELGVQELTGENLAEVSGGATYPYTAVEVASGAVPAAFDLPYQGDKPGTGVDALV